MDRFSLQQAIKDQEDWARVISGLLVLILDALLLIAIFWAWLFFFR